MGLKQIAGGVVGGLAGLTLLLLGLYFFILRPAKRHKPKLTHYDDDVDD